MKRILLFISGALLATGLAFAEDRTTTDSELKQETIAKKDTRGAIKANNEVEELEEEKGYKTRNDLLNDYFHSAD